MSSARVTVICLSHNHEQFVEEALQSVMAQTYDNIQIIIVDDASTDQTVTVINKFIIENPTAVFVPLKKNVGNCSAFNRGLAMAEGDFIIDFATDDVMNPEMVSRSVNHLQRLDHTYGVTFSDAVYIDQNGKFLRNHFQYLFEQKLITRVPDRDVYRNVLSTYFIPSPTMLVRKEVFDQLGGYDEALSYEDFDFWVRASRDFNFGFLPEKLMKIRKSAKSMSKGWYQPGDRQLHSTYLVCEKAFLLNRDEGDREALAVRLKYEIRQSVFSENHNEARLFYELLKKLGRTDLASTLTFNFGQLGLPLRFIRRLYHQLRFGLR